jgi:putative addiction module component (TIGR02574 family)
MSIEERLRLVGKIWDSIVDEEASIELSDAQRAELDRRLADLKTNPDVGDSWQNVKKRIRERE